MRKKLFIILIVIAENVTGQNNIKGYVMDKQTLQPLSYATIGAKNLNYGTYTDSSGLFSLNFLNAGDSIVISHLGYKSSITTVKDIKQNPTLLLDLNPLHLKEVVVNSQKTQKKKMEIGLYSKKSGYLKPPYNLNIQAILIPFPRGGEEIILKSIRFNYMLLPINSPLRIRVLKVSDNGQPGDDLIFENIIFSTNKSGEKHTAVIDISKYNVAMPNTGVYIAFEWIEHNKKINLSKEEDQQRGPCIGAISKNPSVPFWSNGYNQNKWLETTLPLSYSIGLTVVNYTVKK
jgi:hypothetical protein